MRRARVGLVVMWQARIRQWLTIRLTVGGPEVQRGSCRFLAAAVEHRGDDGGVNLRIRHRVDNSGRWVAWWWEE
jgi:hypothetical protein